MTSVDTVARAEIAQTRTQLHQMTTALLKTVAALDEAFQAVERVLPALADPEGLGAEQADSERRILVEARAQLLNTRLYLHAPPPVRRNPPGAIPQT